MKRDEFDFRAFADGFRPHLALDLDNKLIIDLFSGGGGMSTAIEWALGRSPHIAVNHSDDALSMHRANHPQTKHFIADVREVCPKEVTEGRPVGLLHASPDCTHHSQAKGGQPRSAKLRSLSWVIYRWAAQVRPECISTECVKQLLYWGPLIAKRDKATGRVVKLDKTVAAPGEQVPVHEQFLVPDPARVGETWRKFVRGLEALGYAVETHIGCAADYGAPTTRERLFMIARRDGRPIVWPKPTHFKVPKPGQLKWRAAAEAIDFSIECPSIFDRESRGKKPLAENTLRRIAKGTLQYVINSANPFIVRTKRSSGLTGHDAVDEHASPEGRSRGGRLAYRRVGNGSDGIASQRSSAKVAAAMLLKFRFDSAGRSLSEPLPAITAGGNGKGRPAGAGHALGISTVWLAQMNGGYSETAGYDVRRPISTITNKGSQQQVVSHALASAADVAPLSATHLTHLRGNCDARPMDEPVRTISAGGQHHGVVESRLHRQGKGSSYCFSADDEERALRVARFLLRYGDMGYSPEEAAALTRDELLAIVTVQIEGVRHVIVDTGLRMCEPFELYLGQGFPRAESIIKCNIPDLPCT
ncbi:DNA cytosine methyltransferase (plasmid) [Burkholderia vietnamiensis]|uniref:DNA (cytosine-5-)-methyltransferase n=1 Tax=Burkholderia vietnamiensis (strain G4 / LMG 22486) TaxID=269482 RepID=A4JUB0_BURVG|nr:C-5 cytosine-specific DNA methylase [Burkholderia vietnamiensis G4]MCB4349976.1 DNA cytosine methyltransferase [Burkholderia vietnamiensis]